jgi:hypothetical protein
MSLDPRSRLTGRECQVKSLCRVEFGKESDYRVLAWLSRPEGALVKRLLALCGVLLACSLPFISGVQPASANDVCTYDHCYYYADWRVDAPSGFSAVEVMIRTNCMSLSNYVGEIATNELWYATPYSWVESGVTVGRLYGGGFLTAPHGFWADERAGSGGYHEHVENYHGNYTLNSYFDVIIAKASSATTSIQIYGNGTLRGTSTDNFSGWATQLDAGNEISTLDAHTYGSVSSMQWRDLSGIWHNDWKSGTSWATLGPTTTGTPMYGSWVSVFSHFRSGIGPTC